MELLGEGENEINKLEKEKKDLIEKHIQSGTKNKEIEEKLKLLKKEVMEKKSSILTHIYIIKHKENQINILTEDKNKLLEKQKEILKETNKLNKSINDLKVQLKESKLNNMF